MRLKMQMMMPAVLLLAACAAPPIATVATGPEAGPTPAARIAAECRLLGAAHAATNAAGWVTPPDILVGCPGHEGLVETMPLAAQTAALRRANRAALPAAVQVAGPRGEVIYRRMIARGVPEDIAAEVAQGDLLQVAAW